MKKVLMSVAGVGAVVGLLGVLGVGCAAPSYVAGKRVAPAVPAGLSHTEKRIDGKDGVKLFSQSWRPEGEPRAGVVVVHGLKDYSGRYGEFAASLVKRGYAVYAYDSAGMGTRKAPASGSTASPSISTTWTS